MMITCLILLAAPESLPTGVDASGRCAIGPIAAESEPEHPAATAKSEQQTETENSRRTIVHLQNRRSNGFVEWREFTWKRGQAYGRLPRRILASQLVPEPVDVALEVLRHDIARSSERTVAVSAR